MWWMKISQNTECSDRKLFPPVATQICDTNGHREIVKPMAKISSSYFTSRGRCTAAGSGCILGCRTGQFVPFNLCLVCQTAFNSGRHRWQPCQPLLWETDGTSVSLNHIIGRWVSSQCESLEKSTYIPKIKAWYLHCVWRRWCPVSSEKYESSASVVQRPLWSQYTSDNLAPHKSQKRNIIIT